LTRLNPQSSSIAAKKAGTNKEGGRAGGGVGHKKQKTKYRFCFYETFIQKHSYASHHQQDGLSTILSVAM